MRNDYLITLFSRRNGKSRSFNVNRQLLFYFLVLVLLLALLCPFLGHTIYRQRQELKQMHKRIAQLERLVGAVPENPKPRNSDISTESKREKLQPQPDEEPPGTAASQTPEDETTPPLRPDYANVREFAAEPRDTGPGFKLSFRLVNISDQAISGAVAIIAALRPPHQPHFVSFPSMNLGDDGMPIKLRKSVGYSIHRFKYVTGRFSFPFSMVESFRILLYDSSDRLAFDRTIPVAEIDTAGLSS